MRGVRLRSESSREGCPGTRRAGEARAHGSATGVGAVPRNEKTMQEAQSFNVNGGKGRSFSFDRKKPSSGINPEDSKRGKVREAQKQMN